MLDAGNPYMLPSVLVGAAVYLGLTVVTDASLPVRVGALLVFVVVVPTALNRLFGGRDTAEMAGDEATGDDPR
ncbi:hypothetical protein ABNG02_01440 [Halorubrum ejinorense]|uniref:Uncharacterized protein n=1 Tax=Halorubrum ejinorense TaxID=425309 RepID=A0AAV3SP17_9EURY